MRLASSKSLHFKTVETSFGQISPPQLEIASSESPHGGKKLSGQIRVFVSRKGRRQVGYRENEISRAAVAPRCSRIDKNTDTGLYYVHNIELI